VERLAKKYTQTIHVSNKSITFAGMKASVDTENILYSLAYMVLPMSVPDSFDLVSVEEEQNPKDTDILYPTILHLSLDEKDNRGDNRQDWRMNGFSAEHKFEYYPIRDRRVVLHVRRRRWIDSDGHNRFSDLPLLYAKGTGYSDEFGAFLKEGLGYLSRHGK